MVSMRPAAFHGEQWTVLLVWFWNVLDCGFPVALYEDDPAQTVSQHGISLPAAHTRVAPVPAVLALVRSAARVFTHGYENRLCVGEELADFDAARFPASAQLGQDIPGVILA